MSDSNKSKTEAVQIASIDRRYSAEGRLWGMLDDIDTLSDAIKPTNLKEYKEFFRAAIDFANKRHLILKSDGYNLFDVDSEFEVESQSYFGSPSVLTQGATLLSVSNSADYFVLYEKESGGKESFLVDDADSAVKAWDEAVEYIEKEESGPVVIIEFRRV